MELDLEIVKSRYRSILLQAKLVSAFFIVMFLPNMLNGFIDFEGKFGLGARGRLYMMLIGLVVYGVYFGLFFKCPQCRRFPGTGWNRNHCNSCGVELRSTNE